LYDQGFSIKHRKSWWIWWDCRSITRHEGRSWKHEKRGIWCGCWKTSGNGVLKIWKPTMIPV